eukprot:1189692-Prorocentrum_minimum.AAC.2
MDTICPCRALLHMRTLLEAISAPELHISTPGVPQAPESTVSQPMAVCRQGIYVEYSVGIFEMPCAECRRPFWPSTPGLGVPPAPLARGSRSSRLHEWRPDNWQCGDTDGDPRVEQAMRWLAERHKLSYGGDVVGYASARELAAHIFHNPGSVNAAAVFDNGAEQSESDPSWEYQ